jgi:alcohol dehydrogenase (NADP+)
MRYLNGSKSYGGYATHHRAPCYFMFKIPDGVESAHAASMLCGGITTYSPLKVNGCGPGKRVGIAAVGGLEHFGILYAKALNADKVVEVSRKDSKRADVLKLGADDYIATDEDENWSETHARSDHLHGLVSNNAAAGVLDLT